MTLPTIELADAHSAADEWCPPARSATSLATHLTWRMTIQPECEHCAQCELQFSRANVVLFAIESLACKSPSKLELEPSAQSFLHHSFPWCLSTSVQPIHKSSLG